MSALLPQLWWRWFQPRPTPKDIGGMTAFGETIAFSLKLTGTKDTGRISVEDIGTDGTTIIIDGTVTEKCIASITDIGSTKIANKKLQKDEVAIANSSFCL